MRSREEANAITVPTEERQARGISWRKSRPDAGSSFVVELPIAPAGEEIG